MTLVRHPEPRTLRTLNRVLASWLGGDPETADNLHAALLALEHDDDPAAPPWDSDRLEDAAKHLLRLHTAADRRRIGRHELGLVDFRTEAFDPLFARIRVLDALNRLPRDAEPLLWIAGLRERLLPASRKRTPRTVAAYIAALTLIEDIAARHGSHGRSVKLVFL